MSPIQPTLRRLTAAVAVTGLLTFGAVAVPVNASAAGGGSGGQTSTTTPPPSSGGSVKASCTKKWYKAWLFC